VGIELQEMFERKYGNLEGRSYCYCPLIHKSITPLEPDCDSFQSLTNILMYGRTYGRDIMLGTTFEVPVLALKHFLELYQGGTKIVLQLAEFDVCGIGSATRS
jgi:hypothetical protein